jgi:Cell cycle protein
MAGTGEELGLIGVAAVLMIYLLLATRGLRTAPFIRDTFGKLRAAGLSITLARRVFIVAGASPTSSPKPGSPPLSCPTAAPPSWPTTCSAPFLSASPTPPTVPHLPHHRAQSLLPPQTLNSSPAPTPSPASD